MVPREVASAVPRISLVVCLKNELRHVDDLLARLRAMATPGVEVVLVDDRSDDGTGAALRAGTHDLPAVSVLTGPGRGIAAARNFAVGNATGEFVWFGDADDEWDSSIARRLTDAVVAADADLAVCNARKVLDGRPSEPILDAPQDETLDTDGFFSRLLSGEVQGHLWNKVFRRSLLATDPFPPTRAHSDLGGLLRLAPRVRRAVLVPEELYRYLVRPGSILNSSGYRWEDLPDCERLARASAQELGWSPHDRRLGDFSLLQVTLPLVNESVRREQTLDVDAGQLAQVRARCRRAITVRGVLGLVGGSPRAAARAVVFKLAPTLYCAAYRRYRLRRWNAIDDAIGNRTSAS